MKKLLFSAIALVAFSSVSMGNTMQVKRVNCATIATLVVTLQEEDYHNSMANEGVDACWDSYTYNLLWSLAYDKCANP